MRRAANGNRNGRRERAVIGALRRPSQRRWEVEESLEELAGLVEAAGGTVVGRVTQERAAPSAGPVTLRARQGRRDRRGRAGGGRRPVRLRRSAHRSRSGTSGGARHQGHRPAALILDIFAQRARTSEGKLQVELAQLTYLLPRLVGQWTHLERLGGVRYPRTG